MRKHKPFSLYIPELLMEKLNNYLKENPPGFKYDAVYFYFAIYNILEGKLKSRDMDDVYVYISMKHFKEVSVTNINLYLDMLQKGCFIRRRVCERSIRPTGYQITPIYLKSNLIAYEVGPDHSLFKKTIKRVTRERAHNNRSEPFLRNMNKEFRKMELNYTKAREWINNYSDEDKRIYYQLAINLLEDPRKRYFKRNRTNKRLDTNLTNLKSELKNFIIGDLVSIDLKNSQPFFLSRLLATIINQIENENQQLNPLCSFLSCKNIAKSLGSKWKEVISKKRINEYLVNFRQFESSVTQGTLYDDFIVEYGHNISRAEVKDIMFKVMFSKNKDYKNGNWFSPFSDKKKIFKSVFPHVYKSIRKLKEKDHAILPIFLQRLESYIFIDLIAKELVEVGIVPFTIHDSIIVKMEQQNSALEVMRKVFEENFGMVPTFEIKALKLN